MSTINDYLNMEPLSVTKRHIKAPSGDPQDYASFGPYWWPDPTKADGLPYIRRDGEVNPETEDENTFKLLFAAVNALTQEALKTKNPIYAHKVEELLYTWYLDPKLGVHPHFEYAQGIPGIDLGRCFGLIDSSTSYILYQCVEDLEKEHLISQDLVLGLQKWTASFLDWTLHSKLGQEECTRKNNHATWYDVQTTAMALFIGKEDLAKSIVNQVYERRVLTQIEADGSQPEELARTNSLGYSIMNLKGFLQLALWAKQYGWDERLYASTSPIIKAYKFLLPYLKGEPYPYQQIGHFPTKESIQDLENLFKAVFPVI